MFFTPKLLGYAAEEFAQNLYKRCKFEILDRNYRFGSYEVDFIAKRGDVVHFVEVKYRRTLADANLALSSAQFSRIAIAAEEFMRDHQENMQIDALLVDHKLQWERLDNIMIA